MLAILAAWGPIAFGQEHSSSQSPQWGRLANAGFQNQRIRTTLFFAGQARDGSVRYGCEIASGPVLRHSSILGLWA